MNFVDFSSFRVNGTTSPKSLEVRSHMHDTATSKKTGDFLQATRLRRKLPQLFDFYVKSHAWFGGGAILLRGPLRLKRGDAARLRVTSCPGAILLRGPLRLKPEGVGKEMMGAIWCNLTSRPSETETWPPGGSWRAGSGCNLTSRPSETETAPQAPDPAACVDAR